MLNFYTAEDNHGDFVSNLFHFSPPTQCFWLHILLSWKFNRYLLLRAVLQQPTQTLALFMLQSAEIWCQGCCKHLRRTFSMEAVLLWLESVGSTGSMSYSAASRTSYVLQQVHKLWQDQSLNNNRLEASKCFSFVSFATRNLLLSLN